MSNSETYVHHERVVTQHCLCICLNRESKFFDATGKFCSSVIDDDDTFTPGPIRPRLTSHKSFKHTDTEYVHCSGSSIETIFHRIAFESNF